MKFTESQYRLQLITHRNTYISDVKLAEMALGGGCRWIQLRMKNSPLKDIIDNAMEIKQLCHDVGAVFILNDDVQLCKEIGADGVHVGQHDMSVEKARKIQQERFKDDNQMNCNAQMTTTMIQKYCKLDDESTMVLKRASEKYGYSARVIHKLLRLARTSADLDGAESIRKGDVIRVLGCRDLDVSSSQMYAIK